MRLTENFSMAEFLASNTGERLGIDNTPDSARVRGNILRTAMLLERIRALLGKPIIITSGYRCLALNRAVGGAVASAHIEGLAADIIVPGFGVPYDVCRAIEPQMMEFGIDQLIYEHTWTHVGLRDAAPRHQALTLMPGNTYAQGIVLRGNA
jgi:zinc D-Ala-D-Ala carboxypeptidase